MTPWPKSLWGTPNSRQLLLPLLLLLRLLLLLLQVSSSNAVFHRWLPLRKENEEDDGGFPHFLPRNIFPPDCGIFKENSRRCKKKRKRIFSGETSLIKRKSGSKTFFFLEINLREMKGVKYFHFCIYYHYTILWMSIQVKNIDLELRMKK